MTQYHIGDRRSPAGPVRGGVRRYILQVLGYIVVSGAILLCVSGRPSWPMAWIYLAIYLAGFIVELVLLLPERAELLAERSQRGPNVAWWDRVLAPAFALLALRVTLLVAALDVRFGWSASVPAGVQALSLIAFASGYGLTIWALVANDYFSGYMRIQHERDHQVVTDGPYRYVRHPGYLGMILLALGTPLTLGSSWALLPGALGAGLVVVRTVLEDRALRDELPGYADYARWVRYRLVPGVW